MYKPVNAFIFESQDGSSGVNEQCLAAFHEVILPSLEQISNCTRAGRDCSVRSPRRPRSCDVTRPDISRGSGRETETLTNRTRPPQIPVRDAVFCAGQIALVPCSMQLVNGPVALQARLCFSHMEKVLRAMDSRLTLTHVLQAHIYITRREHAAIVTETWNAKLQDIQEECDDATQVESSVVVVPSLPRGAAVELHVMAVQDSATDRSSHHTISEIPGGSVECRLLQSSCARYASLSLTVCLSDSHTAVDSVTDQLLSSYQDALHKTNSLSALCARVFYKSHDTFITQIATGLERRLSGGPAVALVPVEDLPDR
ncbi:diphthine--ammonia ligase [Labeo rohita]|nr:diphthine--ammonia ligase [Labeo rohita]